MKKLVTNKLYMTLFVSDMLSNFGDVLYYLALTTYILQLPNAKLAIAIVGVSETLPILTGFVLGYFADQTQDKVGTILHTLVFRVLLYLLVGFVMGFAPSLWVVIIVSLMNVLSDLAGQYENGLYTPLSLRIIADDERETSFSFRQAVSSLLYIGFQSAGALLVTIMSYQTLAFVNAGTFAISLGFLLLIKPKLLQLIKERPIQVLEKREQALLNDMWQNLKMAIHECIKIPEIKFCMVIVPIVNGLLNVMSIIITVMMSQDSHFVIVNTATTLATISLFNLVGGILGSILGMTLLRRLSMMTAVRLLTVFVSVLFFFFYQHNIYGVGLALLILMMLAAVINPKVNALIMNTLPEERLALIGSGISTYFQLGTILLRLLVSGLILVVPIDLISVAALGLGLILVFYTFLVNREHSSKNQVKI